MNKTNYYIRTLRAVTKILNCISLSYVCPERGLSHSKFKKIKNVTNNF